MLIGFPQAGLDRKVAYRQRSPFATNDCLNVRPTETIENRDRGGSRPGLGETSAYDSLDSEVRLLSPMILAPGSKFMVLREHFRGDTLSSVWEENLRQTWDVPPAPEFYAPYPLPTLTGEGRVTNAESNKLDEDGTAYAIHTLNTIDVTKPYTIRRRMEMTLGGELYIHGFFDMFARLDNITPNTWWDGLHVGVRITENTSQFQFYWASTVNGSNEIGTDYSDNYPLTALVDRWLGATFEGNTLVSISFNGITESLNIAHSNHSGARVGFGQQTTRYLVGGVPPAVWGKDIYDSEFEVEYFTTLVVPSFFHRRLLVASAGGNLYTEWQE